MKVPRSIDEIGPDPDNVNKGSAEGERLIDQSLDDFGAGRGIVIDANALTVAGSQTLKRAKLKGFKIKVVQTDGRKLVVVKRPDMALSADQDTEEYRRARGYAVVDNRVGQVSYTPDLEKLAARLQSPILDLDSYWSERETIETLARTSAPGLAALEQTFGDPAEEDYWPVLRIQVQPETHRQYEALLALEDGPVHERIDAICQAAEEARAGR